MDDKKKHWLDITHKIFSAVRFNESSKLYDLAKESVLPIVEIGSYVGKSSIIMAGASMEGNKMPVYCVDTWMDNGDGIDHFPEFKKNIKHYGVEDKIKVFRGNSAKMSFDFKLNCKDKIGLLFIDGDHSYEGVRRDFITWSRMVNGFIAFHDYISCDGMTKLIDSLMANGADIDLTNSLAVIKWPQKG